MHLYFFDDAADDYFTTSDSPVVPRVGEVVEFTCTPTSPLRGVMWMVMQVHYLMPDQGQGSQREANGAYVRLTKVAPRKVKDVLRGDYPNGIWSTE